MFRPDQMGVYIHWPFCAAKCPYCDFNSHVRGDFDQSVWVDAYVRSLQHYAAQVPDRQVVSIFFGGGTPSLMKPESVATLIDEVQRLWRVSNDVEITLEANPTSVEIDKFHGFRSAGVNRVSLGVQALNQADLSFFGREHSVDEALRAIEIAGDVFDRYSFDLIYARPQQSLAQWESELRRAVTYSAGHLSLYQLTIERGTPFYMRHARGEFSVPDDVKGAEFYHVTQDIMEEAGLAAYEVSNHAAAGQACRHNLIYWQMADYIGIGAGAHGRFMLGDQKVATRDHNAPEIWLQRVQDNGHGAHEPEILDAGDRFCEAVMMGLRLTDGVSIARCEALSGLRFDDMVDDDHLRIAIEQKWLVRAGDILKCSREGMLRLNALIPYILI